MPDPCEPPGPISPPFRKRPMTPCIRTDAPTRLAALHWRQHYQPRKDPTPRWVRRLWLWF